MKWNLLRKRWVMATLFFIAFGSANAQLNRAEYFFDTDPGFGNGAAVTVGTGTDVNFSFNPSVTALSNGLHRLFVRARSDSGWSLSLPQLLYKEAVVNNAPDSIVRMEWFVDADNGFGNGNPVSILPTKDTTLTFVAPISSLPYGLHRVFVRAQDKAGKWSLASQQLFYREAVAGEPLINITRAEWFIDADPGFGAGTDISLTTGSDITFAFNPAIGSIGNGLHRLYVRTQDASGRWSLTGQQLFYKEAVVNNPVQHIIAAEYFFDTDPGFGMATAASLTAGADISFGINGDISGLSNGLHRLFVRTKDAAGHWSLSAQQLFYKEAVVPSPVPNITRAEYFFDVDPGFGAAVNIPLTAGTDITYSFNGDMSALANGLHRLFVRTQDAAGRWSVTAQQLFYKEAAIVNPLVNITEAEYFIDTDPGFGSGTPIAFMPGQDIVFNFSGNIASLSNGLHRLFIRTKDANGKWSITAQQLFFKEAIVNSNTTNLVTLEYFWDNDPGFGRASRVTLPSNSGDMTDYAFSVATPASLSGAKHNLFVRVVDAGHWSLTTVRMFDFTNTPLPVTLLDFSARPVQEKVAVRWITTNEINSKEFEVERSLDGISFVKLGTVAARGVGAAQTAYDFTDDRPVIGLNYYRLKQVDNNGTFKYTPTVAIRFDKAAQFVQLYPNPATTHFVVQSAVRFRRVELTDMNGKLVQQWTVQPSNQYQLGAMAKGMYVVRLTQEDGTVVTKTILVDR